MKIITVIMAGGLGKRMRPLTSKIPKPLVNIGHKKLIDYSLEIAEKHTHRTIVTTFYKSQMIKNYLRENWPSAVCLKDPFLINTGGSLKWHVDYLKRERPGMILVLMSDHIRRINLDLLFKSHLRGKNDITVICADPSPKHNQIAKAEGAAIHYYPKEKIPAGKDLFSYTGECLFSTDFLFPFLENKKETVFDISWGTLAPTIENRSGKVGIFPIKKWVDIGTLEQVA